MYQWDNRIQRTCIQRLMYIQYTYIHTYCYARCTVVNSEGMQRGYTGCTYIQYMYTTQIHTHEYTVYMEYTCIHMYIHIYT